MKLKNIGEVSAKMLVEIDVHNRGDIEKLGPATIYHILKAQGYNVNIMMVYALYGALKNKHYIEISEAEKDELQKQIKNQPFDSLEGTL
ncbi:MAG: hypothetical protein SCALA702_30010 [Melioribacteraceae bacterium]|nr:MAG: hypothetical protein SCALA702_30010 [Melioribacteraceae bacterium]